MYLQNINQALLLAQPEIPFCKWYLLAYLRQFHLEHSHLQKVWGQFLPFSIPCTSSPIFRKSPQPLGHGPLLDSGLFETGLCKRWTGTRSSTCMSGRCLGLRVKLHLCSHCVSACHSHTTIPSPHPKLGCQARKLGARYPNLPEVFLMKGIGKREEPEKNHAGSEDFCKEKNFEIIYLWIYVWVKENIVWWICLVDIGIINTVISPNTTFCYILEWLLFLEWILLTKTNL